MLNVYERVTNIYIAQYGCDVFLMWSLMCKVHTPAFPSSGSTFGLFAATADVCTMVGSCIKTRFFKSAQSG